MNLGNEVSTHSFASVNLYNYIGLVLLHSDYSNDRIISRPYLNGLGELQQ